MAKSKFYVVWRGHQPGVYESWAECQRQVAGFAGAEYKSFARRDEAELAFGGSYSQYRGQSTTTFRKTAAELRELGVILDSVSVDAACSGNPGDLEFQGVHTETRAVLFHSGPYPEGTINIGEFLAIVRALELLQHEGRACPIYSDSQVAIGWVRRRTASTGLARTVRNQGLFEMIASAERWLRENDYSNRILKWETSRWGENPADFERK
jgi:ribonuclease HI